MNQLVKVQSIEQNIYFIRGCKVMIDADLASLYGVTTGNLNKAVSRNLRRFPSDFMFKVNAQEFENLRFQIGSSSSWGGGRYLPRVFTEQGVAMLSGILNSKRSILVNIAIMRTFVQLRGILSEHKELAQKLEALERKYDKQFKIVFDAIRKLMTPQSKTSSQEIGFK